MIQQEVHLIIIKRYGPLGLLKVYKIVSFLLAIQVTQKHYSIMSVRNMAPLILLFCLLEHMSLGNYCGCRMPHLKRLSLSA